MESGWDNSAKMYPDNTMGFDFASFGDKLLTSVGTSLETSLVKTAQKAEQDLQAKLQGELDKMLGISTPPQPQPQPINYTIMQPQQPMMMPQMPAMSPQVKQYLMYGGFAIGGLLGIGILVKVIGSLGGSKKATA